MLKMYCQSKFECRPSLRVIARQMGPGEIPLIAAPRTATGEGPKLGTAYDTRLGEAIRELSLFVWTQYSGSRVRAGYEREFRLSGF
jgi:hypothetical protein